MVTTRLAKKIAVSEGKELSPLRKLPSPKRAKRGSNLAKQVVSKKDSTPSKKKRQVQKQEPEQQEEEAEEELAKAKALEEAQEDSASEEDEEFQDAEEHENEDAEIDGFESTDDEQDENDNEISQDEDKQELEQPKQPKQKKAETHQVKQLPKDSKQISKKQSKIEKGVIYIGRLPEGFEEQELTQYFTQFGEITNVKVPRNKITGRSRHFAFIEFSNKDDAKVAQETMNNYLILNHQLKVNLVNEIFKESKKFKKRFNRSTKLSGDLKTLNSKVADRRNKRKEALAKAGIKL